MNSLGPAGAMHALMPNIIYNYARCANERSLAHTTKITSFFTTSPSAANPIQMSEHTPRHTSTQAPSPAPKQAPSPAPKQAPPPAPKQAPKQKAKQTPAEAQKHAMSHTSRFLTLPEKLVEEYVENSSTWYELLLKLGFIPYKKSKESDSVKFCHRHRNLVGNRLRSLGIKSDHLTNRKPIPVRKKSSVKQTKTKLQLSELTDHTLEHFKYKKRLCVEEQMVNAADPSATASANASVHQRNQLSASDGQMSHIARSKPYSEKASVLRRRLADAGRPYRCEICKCSGDKWTFNHGGWLWNGKSIKLQVDHINGRDDTPNQDRLENLRYLCANCHSQHTDWQQEQRKEQRKDGK